MTDEEIKELTSIDQRSRSNTRRIEKLETETEALHELAAAVKVMASEQAHQTEAIKALTDTTTRLGGKVDALEMKPAKRWESIVEKVVMLIVGALIGLALHQVGIQ